MVEKRVKKVKKERAQTKRAVKPTFAATAAAEPVVAIYDSKGKETESIKLDKKLFTGKVNKAVLYQATVMYNANKRRGTASTKTRGDVSGGGKKPWRQKGTGRARAGSTRSPLWRHGGVIFGPHPRDFHYSIPKKIKRAAFLASLNSKLSENKMMGIEAVNIDEPKTKKFKALVDSLKLKGKSLFVVESIDKNIALSSRNLREVTVRTYKDVNTMDVLGCDNLVMTKTVIKKIQERVAV